MNPRASQPRESQIAFRLDALSQEKAMYRGRKHQVKDFTVIRPEQLKKDILDQKSRRRTNHQVTEEVERPEASPPKDVAEKDEGRLRRLRYLGHHHPW